MFWFLRPEAKCYFCTKEHLSHGHSWEHLFRESRGWVNTRRELFQTTLTDDFSGQFLNSEPVRARSGCCNDWCGIQLPLTPTSSLPKCQHSSLTHPRLSCCCAGILLNPHCFQGDSVHCPVFYFLTCILYYGLPRQGERKHVRERNTLPLLLATT